jgi:hypothetical protein
MTKFHVRYSMAVEAGTAEEAVDQFRAMVASDRERNYFVTNYSTRLSAHYGPTKEETDGRRRDAS